MGLIKSLELVAFELLTNLLTNKIPVKGSSRYLTISSFQGKNLSLIICSNASHDSSRDQQDYV